MRVRDIHWQPAETPPSVSPQSDIRVAAELMQKNSASALLVCDADGTLLGILTERDITRFVASVADGAVVTVGEAMKSDVITCTMDHDVSEILRTMATSSIRYIPVTEKGKAVGILRIRDIMRDHVSALESENRTLRNLVAALD